MWGGIECEGISIYEEERERIHSIRLGDGEGGRVDHWSGLGRVELYSGHSTIGSGPGWTVGDRLSVSAHNCSGCFAVASKFSPGEECYCRYVNTRDVG